jgi:hypothetical protein
MATLDDAAAPPGAEEEEEPRPAERRGGGHALVKVLLESALIVASVLLGFALNEYAERRREAQLAATAVAEFRREIEANLRELERIRPIHQEFLRRLEAWPASRPPQETALEAVARLIPQGGLQINSLDDTAWETATATDVFRLLDFRTATLLSKVYRIQRQYRGSTVMLFQDRLFSHPTFDPSSTRATMALLEALTQQLVAVEEVLAQTYREALRGLPAR